MRLVLVTIASSAMACGGSVGTVSSASLPGAPSPLHVRLLAFNDFHGNLRPPTGRVHGVAGSVGGAAYFAAHVKRLRAGHPNNALVAAGDLIGASPLTSALFHDEPTIDAMNVIGLDAMSIGNHELDEGVSELVRMKRGGCHPVDGCVLTPAYAGARFEVLGANMLDAKTGERVLPPYVVRKFEGISVGFIGMTLEDTPGVVLPASVVGLKFVDEVKTTASLVADLRRQGVESIVVLLHQGGTVRGGGLEDCNDLHGPIVKIAEALDPAVDVIVSGHTHALYNCRVGSRPVTSALSFGRVITTIDLTIDRTTRDVVRTEAHNHAVTHDVTPDADVQAIIDRAVTLAAPREDRVVGHITENIRASTGKNGESPLGALVADAQLEATKKNGAVIALMNTGGLRADLVFAKSGREPSDGVLTYGELFSAQPFGNSLVTVTLTGAEILALLEEGARSGSPLQVSQGFSYRWSSKGTKRVLSARREAADITPDARLRVTVNSFLVETQRVLKRAPERVQGPGDLEAVEAYLRAHPLVSVPKPRLERVD